MANANNIATAQVAQNTTAPARPLGFVAKAMEIEGVVNARTSWVDVPRLDASGADVDEDIDISSALGEKSPDAEERVIVTPRYIIAGGLQHDTDPPNPMEEWDGEGELFHYGRRGRPGEQEQYLAALGYDADGGKDLRAEIVSEILAERVTSAIRKDRVMMARLSALLRSQTYRPAPWSVVLERIKDAIHREGWEFAMDYIADWFCGVPYFVRLADEWKDALAPLEGMLMQADAVAAWMTALERGLIGNPLAVSFDIYEHGGIAYSVSGEGMQCRWDTSRGGAIWVPCEIAEDNIRTTVLGKMGIGTVKWSGALGSAENPLHAQYSLDGGVTWQGHFQKWREAVDAMLQASERQIEPAEMLSAMQAAAEEYCRGVLETYNQFCNGDVYGYTVSVIDRETGEEVDGEGDSLWGIFGMDCAEEELDSAMLAVAGRMLESKTSTTY